eukprot:CAMPEP_0170263762 /NCGR_PEP_ID=MMETSP0116_2-20130129/31770_1 /TAXON_ID=400756 /ORGANISM="Durinskia baltica, Strain CSIRO CS-38" /LENGTH=470 /DNA_ID=CAMNT_0010514843 /DNA_START=24 /DNA_END=1432 /DNA_ORIENTATION=+
MGSGSSARTASESDAPITVGRKAETRYQIVRPAIHVDDQDDGRGNVRPCDHCGETRKTARIGGATAKWLCAACQLESDSGHRPPKKTTGVGEDSFIDPDGAPQPLRLSRSGTLGEASPTSSRSVRRKRTGNSEVSDGIHNTSEEEPQAPRIRRGAKERALEQQGDRPGSPGRRSHRAKTSAAGLQVIEERQDYRSVKGLSEMKEQIGLHRSSTYMSESTEGDDPDAPDSRHPKVGGLPPAPLVGRPLPGGFAIGDRVASLVSRVRGGLLVLEFGQEGAVMGARTITDGGSEVQYLVQFDRGFDWLLPSTQICSTATLPTAKAAGLPRFTWGARVRSLVTYMKPSGSKHEIWLGHSGTVVGPGRTKGKLAVRFDGGAGEFSVWPTAVCEADAYNTVALETLAGGFRRGDRVMVRRSTKGSRSVGSNEKGPVGKGPHTLPTGEEGTVVGPGHTTGRVLVHFDSDDRVWSLNV